MSEFEQKKFEKEEESYSIHLWDIAGQEQNKSLTKIFAKDSLGCIVISDVTDPKTREL